MHDDLTTPTHTPAIAMIARKLMVIGSIILALGLTGVAFAKAEQRRQVSIVWIGRSVVVVPPASEPVEILKPVEKRTVEMEITAYCPCTDCCGPQAQGITASGKHISYNDGRFVAADTRVLPFGTRLTVPGYGDGQAVEVIDRGGAIKGQKLDVFFQTHQQALAWGRQKLSVTIEQ